MKHLKIDVCKSGQDKPERSVTMPLTSLHVSLKLFPKKIKATLEKEGIDLSQCSELVKEKDVKGTLIEIENPNEKMVISIEER
ncbi:MAG: hypothetical protein ABIB41_01585 [Nitrospirota bacterium]